jgi:hypothetical protein
MSLYLDNKVDPIAAAGGRELDFIPKHFHCVVLSNGYYDQRSIRNWIWKNQSGRFAIASKISEDMRNDLYAAFEDSGEAIMFTLILPTLKSDFFDDF